MFRRKMSAGEVGIDNGGNDRVEICRWIAEDIYWRCAALRKTPGNVLGVKKTRLLEELKKSQLTTGNLSHHC